MRKLATVSLSLVFAIFISYYVLPSEALPYCTIVSIVFSFTSLLFKDDNRLRILLITLGLAVGFSAAYINYRVVLEPCSRVEYKEKKVLAELVEYPQIYDNYSVFEVKLLSDNVPNVNTKLYRYEDRKKDYRPGDIISCKAKIKPADEKYGDDFDGNISDGVYLAGTLTGKLEKVGRSKFAFRFWPLEIREHVLKIANEVFGNYSKGFMKALLTGDKTELYLDQMLYSSMGKAGILHCVAVSGMHVAFLVSFLQFIIRKKKYVSVGGMVSVWVFAMGAGLTPSIVRAAFMQSSVLLAPLVKRENDGITSLSTILAILLLINPNSIASVSLQLSFLAMLGIIILSPRIFRALSKNTSNKCDEKTSIIKKSLDNVRYAILSAFAASIGAIAFSTPVASLHFGYVSLVGVLVNIIIFWAISTAFVLGYISCLLGIIWLPLGRILGDIASVFALVIMQVSTIFAKLPNASIYTDGGIFGVWLIIVYIIFAAFWLLRNKERGFRPIIPVCIAICLLCGIIVFTDLQNKQSEASLTVMDVGQGQSIVVTNGSSTAVIDCGGKGKLTNAGDTVAKYLMKKDRNHIDALALTHFDMDHVNGVLRLMSNVHVDMLFVPPDDNKHEVRNEILEFAENNNIEVYIIDKDTDLNLDGMILSIIAPISITEPTLSFIAKNEDYEALITGDIYEEFEERLLMKYPMPDTELFIAGHHGSKYSNCKDLLEAIKAEKVVISSGYNNYGHPSKEAISRFKEANMEIYRTDTEGNLTFKLAS